MGLRSLLPLLLAACATTTPPMATTPLSIVSRQGVVRERVHAEEALTAEEQTRGYQNRSVIPAGTAMLFVFSDDQPRTFWMKDTLVPIDMLFLTKSGTITSIQESAQPCHLDPCGTFSSLTPARFVLELAGGSLARLGITAGDRVVGLPGVTTRN